MKYLPSALSTSGTSGIKPFGPRMGRRSLQSRLIIRLCVVFVIFSLAIGIVTFYGYRNVGADIPYDLLDSDISNLQNALVRAEDGSWSVDTDKIPHDMAYLVRRHDGLIFAQGGKHSDELQPTVPPNIDESSLTWRPVQKPRAHDIGTREYSLTRFVQLQDDMLILQVARRITRTAFAIDELVSEWLGEFLPLSLPLLGVLLIALVFTLHRALRPLDNLMHYARAINPTHTGLRLPTADLPAELFEPVEAINEALDRLDRGFQAQRDFLADAAHELRTPLAILAAHLDSIPDKNASANLRADVDRMSRLVGQLLMVAQLEALTIKPDESADLSAIATEIAALIAPLAYRRNRGIAVINADHPILVKGNRDTIYQALRNLVENALKFTAEGTDVEIVLDPSGSVTVADRGPGIPQIQRSQLFQRFWRADRRQSGGAGLGLAIAHRIAVAHHGSLTITDNPEGGTRFTLTIPMAVRS